MFGNYSKVFLLEYEEIKTLELTSRAYHDLNEYEKIFHEIGIINQEMKKITLDTDAYSSLARGGHAVKKRL